MHMAGAALRSAGNVHRDGWGRADAALLDLGASGLARIADDWEATVRALRSLPVAAEALAALGMAGAGHLHPDDPGGLVAPDGWLLWRAGEWRLWRVAC